MQSFSVYKRKKDRRKKNAKWIVAWTTAGGKRKAKTAFTDYQASVELGRNLARKAAMQAVGQADPFEDHRERPIGEHLEEFIEGLRSANRSPRYVLQMENRIKRILKGLKIERLDELDPVAVDRFLTDLAAKNNLSGITRNEYANSIKSFTKWAVTYRRLKDDPLAGLKLIERRSIEPAHPRRALTMTEIARLLEAAETRPLRERQTIRTGPRTGQLGAKVRPRVKERAIRKGRERRIVYLLAVWTGLRRSEIRQLTWRDVHLDTIPGHISLRASTTKSKRADTLPIHPQLADALRNWRPDDAADEQPVVSIVPNMKCLRADLALAGIPDKDASGRYVDFHSLRVSLSTLLAANKVSPRIAQALMRHTDPRLTAGVYTDEKLLPLAAELQNVPDIPTQNVEASCLDSAQAEAASVVAGLTAHQRHALLEALSQCIAG